jgi:hypothetical protein
VSEVNKQTRIAFHNIEGLQLERLQPFLDSISSGHFDIVFLAETYYINVQTGANLAEHPNFLAHSTPAAPNSANGKRYGGIIAFGSLDIKRRMRSTKCHQFTLSITTNERTFTAVYLPPSLNNDDFVRALNRAPPSDLVVGDFNVRYPDIYNQIKDDHNTRDRRVPLDRWATERAITISPSKTGIPNVDHAFTLWRDQTTVMYAQPNYALGGGRIPTHGVLIIDMLIPTAQMDRANAEETDNDPILRWKLKGLSTPAVCVKIQQDYVRATPRLDTTLENARTVLQQNISLPQRQRTIDNAYNAIMDTIKTIAGKHLGAYVPQEAKRKPDRTQAFLQHCRSGINDFLRLFKRTRRSGVSCVKIASRDPNKSPAEDARDFYEGIYQSRPAPPPHPPRAPPNDPRDNIRCTPHFIWSFFRTYDVGKSCGKDGFHTQLARIIGQDTYFNTHIKRLFDLCTTAGVTPSDWNLSIINPIPKGNDQDTIDAQRPIALTAMLRRCYESLVHRSIQQDPELSEALKVNFAQAGFQHNQSTMLHVMASHEHQRLTNGIQIFIDLKAAYDRVDLTLLFKILERRKVPRYLLNIIWSLFAGCTSQIAINGKLTAKFTRFTGLFQGSLLAPMLWNVYMDGLAEAINQTVPVGLPFALFFADDIKLQYDCRDLRRTLQIAQIHLNLITAWCDVNNMIPGIKKCGVIFPHGIDINGLPPLMLNKEELPVVTLYKYLGFEMSHAGLAWDLYVARITEKAKKILMFARIEGRTWRPSLRVAAYKTFVRSVLEYGAPLLHCFILNDPLANRPRNKDDTQSRRDQLCTAMEQIQDDALQWIFGTKRVTQTHRSLAATMPMRDRLLHLATTFTQHLEKAPAFHPTKLLLEEPVKYNIRFDRRMMHQCLRTPLSNEYKDLVIAPPRTKQPLDVWLRARNRENFIWKYGRLAAYATGNGRSPAGMDYTLDIRDNVICRAALNWRLNNYDRAVCRCGRTLRRSHIDECPALRIIAMEHRQVEQLAKALSGPAHPTVAQIDALDGTHYCCLDRLLNARQYDTFYVVLTGLLADGDQLRAGRGGTAAAPALNEQTNATQALRQQSQQRRAMDIDDDIAAQQGLDDEMDLLLSDDDVAQPIEQVLADAHINSDDDLQMNAISDGESSDDEENDASDDGRLNRLRRSIRTLQDDDDTDSNASEEDDYFRQHVWYDHD